MNKITLEKKSLNTQRPRVDRFVARRDSFPELKRRMTWNSRGESPAGDINWYTKNLQQKKYIKYLDEAFGLEPLPQYTRELEPRPCVQGWPCAPRKKSYISSADSILDLPNYSYATFPELLDWSNDNILVAALGKKYYKWSWRTQSLISQGLAYHGILSCRFDPRNELLLLATEERRIEIHDNAHNKWLGYANCNCTEVDNKFCAITAIDWSPSGNAFVMGCSRGTLSSITQNTELIEWKQVMRGAVLMVRVSPDARYVAASAIRGKDVLIFSWPNLDLYTSMETDWTIQTLSWHPWRSALLGIGLVTSRPQARLSMWDIPTGNVGEYELGQTPHAVDAMLFSNKTGELVLSLWNADRAATLPKSSSQLVVLSDPVTVVDKWGEDRSCLDRVRTMVFSPDGTKLATATSDEDLIIWNFLPEDRTKKKKNGKKFYSMPVFLDVTTYSYDKIIR